MGRDKLSDYYLQHVGDWPGLLWRIYGQYSHRLISTGYTPDNVPDRINNLPVVRAYGKVGKTKSRDHVHVLVDDSQYNFGG